MATIVAAKIFEMFVIFVCGIIVYKVHLIDAPSTSKMSNLLMMCVSPLLIFESYQIDFDTTLLVGLVWSVFASLLCFAAMIILSQIFFRGPSQRAPIEKIATVYSNCGFIGLPLVNGVLGSEGVFYATAFNTVFNLMLWTHGVLIMDPAAAKNGKRFDPSTLKNLITPPIISVFLGIFCFVVQLRLPTIVTEPLDMIAAMNTPLAMIIAGANLAQSDFLHSLKNPRIYLISFVKLLVFPLVSLFILWLLPLRFEVSFSLFLCIACPAGATTIMFADRYHRDAPYASELFVTTTVLCAITIPVLAILAEMMLQV